MLASASRRVAAGGLRGATQIRRYDLPHGPPGRSALSGVNVIVFGATGFVGRYVVGRLGRVGSRVVVPFRGDQHAWRHLKVMGDVGQVVPVPYDSRDDWSNLGRAFENAHVVINLVGRDYQKGISYDDVHVGIAEKIAKLSAEAGVERLIHFSALGASKDSPSAFLRSKAAGEEAVSAAFPLATIMRPANIIGPEDRFLNSFAFRSKALPILPLAPGVADAKKQPVNISDVATAVMNAIGALSTAGKTYELAGADVFTVGEFLERMFALLDKPNNAYTVPSFVMDTAAGILKNAPFPPMTPDTLVTDALDIVASDGVPGLPELGVDPVPLDDVILTSLLRQYKKPKHFSDADDRHDDNVVPVAKQLHN